VNADEARARFASERVACLATVGAEDHRPHLVPMTFALLDEATVVSAVDHKPKRTTALKRLANIVAHPAVSILVDHYEDDWSRLWWARADGRARVIEPPVDPAEHARAVRALQERYPAYRDRPPDGSIVVITVERWSGWSATTRT